MTQNGRFLLPVTDFSSARRVQESLHSESLNVPLSRTHRVTSPALRPLRLVSARAHPRSQIHSPLPRFRESFPMLLTQHRLGFPCTLRFWPVLPCAAPSPVTARRYPVSITPGKCQLWRRAVGERIDRRQRTSEGDGQPLGGGR